jgi:hypothetical protein
MASRNSTVLGTSAELVHRGSVLGDTHRYRVVVGQATAGVEGAGDCGERLGRGPCEQGDNVDVGTLRARSASVAPTESAASSR